MSDFQSTKEMWFKFKSLLLQERKRNIFTDVTKFHKFTLPSLGCLSLYMEREKKGF